jgi:hypothetical protein
MKYLLALDQGLERHQVGCPRKPDAPGTGGHAPCDTPLKRRQNLFRTLFSGKL